MTILKLFSLRSRIAKRITELENEVSKLESVKYESCSNYEVYVAIMHDISNKRAVINELKSLI